MKFKKLSLLLLGGVLLAGCSKASAIELSVVPNQSMVTGKAIVIDVKTEPVISIDPNSIEISGGESWVENGVIKFKASEPGQYTMKVTQDNVTSNTITIPLDTSSAIAKNETQSTSKSSKSTTSKSSTQSSPKPNSPTNNQTNTNPTLNQGQANQTPTQNTTPTTPSGPTTSTTPSSDPTSSTPAITPDPEPSLPDVVAPSEDTPPAVDAPSVEEETPNVEETPAPQPDPTPDQPAPTPSVEDDPASTVQDTSMSVDQVYEDQSELLANKTPITVDGILPEALVSNGSGKEEQVLWNEDLKEYIVLEGFTIPFGGCNAQVSGTLSRNAQGQLVLNMTYISTDDVPKTGGTGYHDVTSSTKSTTDDANASAIDRNNPTPHPEPGTGQ